MTQAFPDYLYKLTPRDAQVTPLEIVQTSGGVSQATVTVGSGNIYTVPKGKVLAISSLCGVGAAGAGQTFLSWWAQYLVNGSLNNSVIIAGGTLTSGAGQLNTINPMNNMIYIPEGGVINGTGYFSGSAAANSFALHLTGLLIPRGNIAI